MAIQMDVATGSQDSGYNGKVRILCGKARMVAGSIVEPLPASLSSGNGNANYTSNAFNNVNAGRLQVSVDVAFNRLVILSTNVADDNEVTWMIVGE